MSRKIFLFPLMSLMLACLITSCNDNTYANELNQEQELIKSYIKRNNINVIHYLPESDKWGPNDYYLSISGLYYHLNQVGSNLEDTIQISDRVIPRYKQFYLTTNSDTVSNWSSIDNPYPAYFVYGTSDASPAFQEAAGLMKFNDAVASLIVFSKINTSPFWKPATPVGYIYKIKFQKN